MPSVKQNKNALPTLESSEEKQQFITFFKSYLRYIKKMIECSSSETGS